MLKAITAAGKLLLFIERAILVLMLSMMIVLAFTQIILRNYFETSIYWADPLLRHLVLWSGFIGAGVAAQQEKHLNLDILSRYVSARILHIIRVLVSLFAAAICYFLTSAAWTFLQSEMEAGDELFSAGGVSYLTWWFQSIIPAGFALLTFHFILKAIEHALGGGAASAAEAHGIPPESTPNVPVPGAPTSPETEPAA